MTRLPCLQCGASLENRRAGTLYCGAVCRRRYNRGVSQPADDRKCQFCEGPMVGRKAGSVFCSRACLQRSWGGVTVKDPGRLCGECGDQVGSRHLNARFCSTVCKNRYHSKTAAGIRSRESFRRSNRHVAAAVQQSRRARRHGGESAVVTPRDWQALCRRFDHRCAYCQAKALLTMEHVVPLSRGGRHAIGNILPACRKCNSEKHARFIMEWRMGKSRRSLRRETHVLAA